MNQSEIEHMAQGLLPSLIGKDHEEVVIWLATQLLDVQQKLGVAIKRGDACMQAEIVWEKAMMAAIGEDGVGCVVKAIAALKAKRDALAAENAALKQAADFATADDMWIEQHDGMLDYRYKDWYVDVLKQALETPVTDASLNAIRAEGVIMFATKQLAAAGDLESTITLERLMLEVEEFAGQLRGSAGQEAK